VRLIWVSCSKSYKKMQDRIVIEVRCIRMSVGHASIITFYNLQVFPCSSCERILRCNLNHGWTGTATCAGDYVYILSGRIDIPYVMHNVCGNGSNAGEVLELLLDCRGMTNGPPRLWPWASHFTSIASFFNETYNRYYISLSVYARGLANDSTQGVNV
jgi:hypothetical protein